MKKQCSNDYLFEKEKTYSDYLNRKNSLAATPKMFLPDMVGEFF